MKLSGHRIMGLGVLLMTTYMWVFPSMVWLVDWAYVAPRAEIHGYAYTNDTMHLILSAYFVGAVLTIIGGVITADERYKRDPQSFTRFSLCNFWTPDFWAKRILTLGIQFLLSPIWCFLIINDLAIKIAAEKVGYGSLLLFDCTCVGLQGETLMMLYTVGFYVTLIGFVLVVLAGREPQLIPKLAAAP
jgi:hypothetical protein